MRLLVLLTSLILSTSVWSVCMTELDGELRGCLSMQDNKDAVKWCKKRHGEEYLPYYTTNHCSKEYAAMLRGEEYRQNKHDLEGMVAAACMSYEQGTKRGCVPYEYDKAERYCISKYGHRYIPFIIDGKKCTEGVAQSLMGLVSPRKLVEGLASDVEELEKLMTMVDREGINSSLGSFINAKPNIGNEFYSQMIKTIMAKMNMVKDKLYKHSHYNIPISNENSYYVKQFIKFNFRYMSLVGRLYKLYAYVAHQNQYVLKTYKYSNLEYLNLKLKKEYALELLAKVNYNVITVEEGKSLEFRIGEQEKQTFEYQAIQDPKTKVEYAKLISFMGVRENLTNLWAVQRITPNNISNSAVSSCGKDFLTFRPGRHNLMQNSAAMQDLEDYDVFYNEYAQRWDKLIDKSRQVNILDNQKSYRLMFNIMYYIPKVKEFLQSQSEIPMESIDDFKALAKEDADMLVMAEEEAWESFSNDHFPTIVMPGDSIKNKYKIINRIWRDAYTRRVNAIVDTFLGAYVWLDDSTIKQMEKGIRAIIEKDYKDDFFARFKTNMLTALEKYNDKYQFCP
jgi:hypothetical protein